MSEIAEFALMPAPSLTRLIDRMVTDGLVYRTVDARDRRRVLVHLTARGRDLQRRSAGGWRSSSARFWQTRTPKGCSGCSTSSAVSSNGRADGLRAGPLTRARR